MGTRHTRLLLGVLALTALPIAAEGDEATPATGSWAEDFGVWVSGGPASGDVRVRLNDRVVGTIAGGEGSTKIEIADALRRGFNELRVEFSPTASPPAEPGRLSVTLAVSDLRADGMRVIREPVAETALPATPPAESCADVFHFIAGETPDSTGPLKKNYFMVIHGPPIGHLVTIRVNGVAVFTATSGERFFELTPFLEKGKNEVLFEATPTCGGEEILAEGNLVFIVAAGKITEKGINWDGPPVVRAELEPREKPEPFVRRHTIRAR